MGMTTSDGLLRVAGLGGLALVGVASCFGDSYIEGAAAGSEIDPPGACGEVCLPEQCSGTPTLPNCQGLDGSRFADTCSTCGQADSWRVEVVGAAYQLQSCSLDSGGRYALVEVLPPEKVVEACPGASDIVCRSQPDGTVLDDGACCGGAVTDLTTDPRHCGSCGNDCGTGGCVGGQCAPAPGSPAGDGQQNGGGEQDDEGPAEEDSGERRDESGEDDDDFNDGGRGGAGGGGGGDDAGGAGGVDSNGSLCGDDFCGDACIADANGEPCDEAHMRCMRLHGDEVQRCQADGSWATWWIAADGQACCQALAAEVHSCIQNEDYIPDAC